MAYESVQLEWALELPLQQQSVLLLAIRGPDGVAKFHPCKEIVRAYRATVLRAAMSGKTFVPGDAGDTFMSMKAMFSRTTWDKAMSDYINHVDELPHHYHMHLMHGAEIIGYHHPDGNMAQRWLDFYYHCCHDLHLRVESREAMDGRLNDGGRHG